MLLLSPLCSDIRWKPGVQGSGFTVSVRLMEQVLHLDQMQTRSRSRWDGMHPEGGILTVEVTQAKCLEVGSCPGCRRQHICVSFMGAK